MRPWESVRLRTMKSYVEALQARICAALEERESARFRSDAWERPGGGGGLTRVMQQGALIEKGGVNVSTIWGDLPVAAAERLSVEAAPFAACGLSLVLHPRTPRVPAVHMNIRYFELGSGPAWYGGGADLSPSYPHPEDFRHFHTELRDACESVTPGSYRTFKDECDRYFTLRHRNEMRGVGGVFFDNLREDLDRAQRLVFALGDAFPPAFLPIVDRRRGEPYTPEDRAYQLVRRGRYVEFNLLYDRGTQFGLATSGRVESILMSLPPLAAFPYEAEAPAAEVSALYQPRDWA